MPKRATSRRPDGRGHWPRGRRRNDPGISPRELRALIRRVRGVLSERWSYGQVSQAALARRLGVSPKTIHRWISGEDVPPAPTVRRLTAWLATHEEPRR